MKPILKIALLLLLPFFSKSQPQHKELDSLHTALKNAANDTIRMVTLVNLAGYFAESNRDSAMLYTEAAIPIAKKMNQQLWIAKALLYKSYLVQKQANFSLSLKLCNQAMEIVQDEKNEKNAYIPKEDEFATNPGKYRQSLMLSVFHQLGNTWAGAGNKEKAIEYFKEEIRVAKELKTTSWLVTSHMNIGNIFLGMEKLDSAFIYSKRALENVPLSGWKAYEGFILKDIGEIYIKKQQLDSALYYYNKSLLANREQNNVAGEMSTNISMARFYQKAGEADSMKYYANTAFQLAANLKSAAQISTAANLIADAWKMHGNADSAFTYLTLSKSLGDSLHKDLTGKLTQFQNANFDEQMRLEKEAQQSAAFKSKVRTTALFIGLGVLSVLAFVFYRNNRQKQKANKVLETTLTNLKSTQSQLIQSEKMASLGELTAGIAHEIQNPLNFVNNFSEVSNELIQELKVERLKVISERDVKLEDDLINDISENMTKINHHGKRAGSIVSGMLQHSRTSKGVKEPTDINALADEYLRLAYHGLRAKDKDFNATIKTEFDETIGKLNIVPQDIGRVILNLITNAFYAVNERQKLGVSGYQPTVTVTTHRSLSSRDGRGEVLINVKDNGTGIPQKIIDKIFQPFFTTKPTGQGTGLGLSLSYDIVKAHGGELKVETKEGEGSIFIIQIPLSI
jgi:two-component system, NtrC family, sensor kinase